MIKRLNNKGKLIVIDGTDGSGKTTQLELLMKYLESLGKKVKIADFPRYNQKSAGMVEEYLDGKFGNANEVSPRQASIFYAIDRFAASSEIAQWLNDEYIVISNRYVSSSMAHQGCKIALKEKRAEFFKWLIDLEYNIFKIPKPDLTLILHVKAEIAQKLSQARKRREWKGKIKDIHEEDLNHLKKSEKVYIELSKILLKSKLIECSTNNSIKDKKEIQQNIIKIIGDFF